MLHRPKIEIEPLANEWSNVVMTAIRRHSAIIFKILVVVFSLNATASFGNCCAELDQQLTQATQPPCHQTEAADEADTDTCCAVCIVMQPPQTSTLLSLPLPANGAATLPAISIPHDTEPLYRPPISTFS